MYTSRTVRSSSLFLFTAPPTTEIYTLSLHDALPISALKPDRTVYLPVPLLRLIHSDVRTLWLLATGARMPRSRVRSEEHTSELQSRPHLVCRLLLEKKKKKHKIQKQEFARPYNQSVC